MQSDADRARPALRGTLVNTLSADEESLRFIQSGFEDAKSRRCIPAFEIDGESEAQWAMKILFQSAYRHYVGSECLTWPTDESDRTGVRKKGTPLLSFSKRDLAVLGFVAFVTVFGMLAAFFGKPWINKFIHLP
ncbi:hypothetical protein PAPYR_364 [Paratrimastix pyriformis]|uniref:Uncharacterized protein n=1 Tax=Paratrimastix pyriformis TaxID=342808 RepID=A0ABQ8V0F4_9EUKA|nr:hypothetical protein PAPYR_364 [Paratrimastix pyriformis]